MTPVWNFTGSDYWINPWTYKWGEGLPPKWDFFIFFLDDETSAPDVLSSCSFILRAHFQTSLVTVSYYGYGYDVISSRWSSKFWVKMHVFSTFFNNTNNLWMKWYKVRIYGLLYMSSTENDHLSRFYVTCFLILGKMQDGDCSAWITSNLFVRSPQPKLLDLSILFSLVKLFFSSASIHLLIIRWT